jgi:hypothetical protein
MTGVIIAFFLPIYLIGLLVMALFQLIGGKFIAKLENAKYGSAFLISLFSSLLTSLILLLFAGMEILSNLGVGGNIVLSLLLSIISLTLVTKWKWNCSSILESIKASSVNIILTAIFWIIVLSKFSEFH